MGMAHRDRRGKFSAFVVKLALARLVSEQHKVRPKSTEPTGRKSAESRDRKLRIDSRAIAEKDWTKTKRCRLSTEKIKKTERTHLLLATPSGIEVNKERKDKSRSFGRKHCESTHSDSSYSPDEDRKRAKRLSIAYFCLRNELFVSCKLLRDRARDPPWQTFSPHLALVTKSLSFCHFCLINEYDDDASWTRCWISWRFHG